MSDNWVVQNLQNALDTWNSKLAEIWQLLTTSPQQFKGGSIWSVMVTINGAVQAIGLALLVLFFVVGVVKTCGSFTEVKKPEHALKLFIRFAIAKGVITYGLELMLALFNIVQGTISTIMQSAGFGSPNQTTLPAEMITTIESCGFFESIPLWAVTLIGGLFITVLSFIMIMTVYGRFFKLYMYTALAPIPLSTFAGEPSQNVGKSFIKSYCAVLLEGAVIVSGVIREDHTDPRSGILHHEENVDLLPANIELSAMEMMLVTAMSRETILRSYLSKVKDNYDYVLIDCMPSLGMVTLNALAAADSVIIPVQAQYLPAKGMTQLMQTIGKVRQYINPSLRIDGILLNIVDNRTNLAKSTADALRKNFGSVIKIYRSSIPMAVKAAEVASKGVSIYKYEPSSPVAKAYAEFAKEVSADGRKKERLHSADAR